MLSQMGDFPSIRYVCFSTDTEMTIELFAQDGVPRLCGNSISYIIFLSFILAMSMMILNLFIAVVLEGFTESMNDAKRCINTDS